MQQTRTARANPVASLRESYGTLSRFLTDDPVRQLWVSPFPSYPDVHKGRSLYFSGGCSFSALCIASSYGLYDVLQQILSSGIDPIDPERGVNCVDGGGGRSPLSWAASRGYMALRLHCLTAGRIPRQETASMVGRRFCGQCCQCSMSTKVWCGYCLTAGGYRDTIQQWSHTAFVGSGE